MQLFCIFLDVTVWRKNAADLHKLRVHVSYFTQSEVIPGSELPLNKLWGNDYAVPSSGSAVAFDPAGDASFARHRAAATSEATPETCPR